MIYDVLYAPVFYRTAAQLEWITEAVTIYYNDTSQKVTNLILLAAAHGHRQHNINKSPFSCAECYDDISEQAVEQTPQQGCTILRGVGMI